MEKFWPYTSIVGFLTVCLSSLPAKADSNNSSLSHYVVYSGLAGINTTTACNMPEGGPNMHVVRHKEGFPTVAVSGPGHVNWSFEIETVPHHGLEVSNLRVSGRFMADRMNAPRYYVKDSKSDKSADPEEKKFGIEKQLTRCVKYTASWDKKAKTRYRHYLATYVDHGHCLFLTQDFCFGPLVKDPEPSHLVYAFPMPLGSKVKPHIAQRKHLWAAYMYPRATFRWSPGSDPDGKVQSVGIMQAFRFQSSPDSGIGAYHAVFTIDSDYTNWRILLAMADRAVNFLSVKPLIQQFDTSGHWYKVIENGKFNYGSAAACDWYPKGISPHDWVVKNYYDLIPDNYHETYRSLPIDEPKGGTAGGDDILTSMLPGPGCPECVHTHWRWPAIATIGQLGVFVKAMFLDQKTVADDLQNEYNNILSKYFDSVAPGGAYVPYNSPQNVYVGDMNDQTLYFSGFSPLTSDSFFIQPVFYSDMSSGHQTVK